MDSYLALVPRGLQDVIRDMVMDQLGPTTTTGRRKSRGGDDVDVEEKATTGLSSTVSPAPPTEPTTENILVHVVGENSTTLLYPRHLLVPTTTTTAGVTDEAAKGEHLEDDDDDDDPSSHFDNTTASNPMVAPQSHDQQQQQHHHHQQHHHQQQEQQRLLQRIRQQLSDEQERFVARGGRDAHKRRRWASITGAADGVVGTVAVRRWWRLARGDDPPPPPPPAFHSPPPHEYQHQVSLGYRYTPGNDPVASDGDPCGWTVTGLLPGTVWLHLATRAPVTALALGLRGLGPLLALIHVGEESDARSGPTPTSWAFTEDVPLPAAVAQIQQAVQALSGPDDYTSRFQAALNLWQRHVQECWPLEPGRKENLPDGAPVAGSSSRHGGPLRYRLSCLRHEAASKKKYSYRRDELLAAVADILVPEPYQSEWIVDLVHYDVEIVLLLRPDTMAVGLNLRPYQQRHEAKSFGHGHLPPDIHPPYLSGSVLSGLVRLRPSTAQALLHLAELQAADLVLDPCAGIGTIPMEALFSGNGSRRPGPRPVVALGGDLALNADQLGPVGATYSQQARQWQHQQRNLLGHPVTVGGTGPDLHTMPGSVANLLAWDAGHIPIQSGRVDAIVSDLPFGRSCMDSNQLERFYPLLVSEMARLLRPRTGRMVLLCGWYVPLLQALQSHNHYSAKGDGGITSRRIWELPCQAVWPVTIGGLLAWIVQVRRGPDPYVPTEKDHQRIKSATATRQRKAKRIQWGQGGRPKPPRRIQA